MGDPRSRGDAPAHPAETLPRPQNCSALRPVPWMPSGDKPGEFQAERRACVQVCQRRIVVDLRQTIVPTCGAIIVPFSGLVHKRCA